MHSTAGDDAEPTVSVVLCVRNGVATLDRQLAALAAQEYEESWEIVLVDNASTDGTGTRALAWTTQLPWLRVVEEPKVGLNRARNRGVRAARAGRLVMCDADDEVAPGWLRAMTAALGQFDIVGGRLEPDVGTNPRLPSSECPQHSELPTVFDRPYAVGASMGFVRRAFDAVGGFDERFSAGADEVDFCLCAQDAGCSIGFAPDASARYGAKQTTRGIVRQRFTYGRGLQRLLAKHAALGRIHSPPAERWKFIGMSARSLVKDAPQLLRRSTRSPYLARLAHLVGEIMELAGTELPAPFLGIAHITTSLSAGPRGIVNDGPITESPAGVARRPDVTPRPVLDEPPSELRYRRKLELVRSVREFWHGRELLWALTEREFQARYAQTWLGIGWALVTPILLMLVFMLFVNRVVNVDTHGAPYSVFVFLGLLPWTFFSSSVSRGGQVLVFESSVLNKVRCPREVFPISAITVAGYDFALSVFVLGLLFIVTGYEPRTTSFWAPLFLVIQIAFCAGVALGLSVVVVFVRDVGQAIPLLLQLGLFATPVAYDINAIPHQWQPLYAAVNPLVGVIEGYRDTILYGLGPPWRLVIPSAISAFVVLVGGYVLFRRLERGIADVA